jgi:hypothetical protein
MIFLSGKQLLVVLVASVAFSTIQQHLDSPRDFKVFTDIYIRLLVFFLEIYPKWIIYVM